MNKFLKLMLASYILMLMPQVLAATLLGRGKATVLYLCCYFINILLFLGYAIKYKPKTEKKSILLLTLYTLVLSITLISNIFLKIDTAYNDFADFIVKILNMLFFYCLIPKNEIVNEADLRKFFKVIVMIGVLSCIYNIIKNYSTIFSFYKITRSYTINMCGFFSNRNTYGQFLFICIMSNLYLLRNDNRRMKIFHFLIMILLITNLIFTMSRGSILATAVLLYLYYYSSTKNKIRLMTITALVIVLSVIIVITNNNLSTFISNNFIRSDAGTAGRSTLWLKGLEVASSNIINGIGYYTGLETISESQFHSFYIDTIVESGIIGLIFKILFFCSVYLKVREKNSSCNLKYYTIMSCAYISIFILSFFESINFFLLGYTETQITVFFVSLPLFLLNANDFKDRYSTGV